LQIALGRWCSSKFGTALPFAVRFWFALWEEDRETRQQSFGGRFNSY
jgi:hypothetical protein